MAAETLTTTRRALLGAAAAFPVLALSEIPRPVVIASVARQSSSAAATWNRRLARYRQLHAHWKAEAESGAFRAANDRYNREYAELSTRFGSWEKASRSKTGKPLCAAAFARISAAEDAYYYQCTAPMQRATTRLIHTPASHLHALLAKIETIREYELEDMRPQPLKVLWEDVSRLASG